VSRDPYKYFRTEAGDIVEQLSKDVLGLEKGPRSPESVAKLLRLAHTLKGAARVVKQREIAELAHAMEDALGPLRDERAPVTRDRVESLLGIVDAIRVRVPALSPAGDAERPQAQQAPVAVEPLRTVRADLREMDALLDGLGEVGVELASVRQRAIGLKDIRRLADLVAEHVAPKILGDRAPDALEARAAADDLCSALASLDRDLSRAVEQTDRELRQARELAERLRLVPSELMFNTLERAARDAAATLGKRVAFEAKGGEVRIDADVLAGMQSALVHAVRNAVAHGIEAPPARAAAGKPEVGRVTLQVARRAGRVFVTCRDDGQGINMQAVARAAVRAGKLEQAQAASDGDLLRLLLAGGISTSPAVTDVSGRGVGLDVVRETVSRLGGEVSLRTEPGQETVLEMMVPVSLSSLDSLLLESGGARAAVPLEAVRATLRLGPSDVTRSGDTEAVLWGGKVVPFAPLARALDAGTWRDEPSRPWSVVVLEGSGTLAAVGVDRLVGVENMVVRALPKEARVRPVIGGASLDAEGTPQPVLDPAALVARVRAARMAAPGPAPARQAVLVIDDSLTTRMLEQSILESAGYEVDVATSAEEGLAKALRRRYALFLVDVEMPGMDGFTFVERTRSDPGLRLVPAILVTSRAAPEDRRRGEAVGASGYIVKSEFDQTVLLDRIRKLVG